MAPPRQIREFSGINDEARLHQLHMAKMRLSASVSISRLVVRPVAAMVVMLAVIFVSAQPGGLEWITKAVKYLPLVSRLFPA